MPMTKLITNNLCPHGNVIPLCYLMGMENTTAVNVPTITDLLDASAATRQRLSTANGSDNMYYNNVMAYATMMGTVLSLIPADRRADVIAALESCTL